MRPRRLTLTLAEQLALDYAWWIVRCEQRNCERHAGFVGSNAANAMQDSLDLLARLGASTRER